ncbi:MAG TPA: L-seryl-tRNA(Sec) selenium transferase [Chthoniobacterales bacterium]|jgi:L-seryl-tRNA(Ser) seleniumtransferase
MHEGLNERRSLPAVSKVLGALAPIDLPRPIIVDAIRRRLAVLRKSGMNVPLEELVHSLEAELERHRRKRLQIVVNATGIVLHTNFGRAPLHPDIAQEIAFAASTYGNVEFDLCEGRRGGRADYLEHHLALLCGAESAMVVNNCAAALVLLVSHFAPSGKAVVISRGELVQIGGGFRIGEILATTGAEVREVGATNQTSLRDYEKAIDSETGFILSVHRSNFFMEGFVDSPPIESLAELSRRKRVPLVADLGSGALGDFSAHSPEPEPTPDKVIKAGADLVCFSGDKLFGGTQAGIIAGRKKLIAALKRHPLYRALRCDKLRLLALQSTVDFHLRDLTSQIPAIALLEISKDELRARAAVLFDRLRGLPARITMGRGTGKTGGGSLPRSNIPSITVDIVPDNGSLKAFAELLRSHTTPVIGYVSGGAVKLDLRTVFPFQDDILVDAIRAACAAPNDSEA